MGLFSGGQQQPYVPPLPAAPPPPPTPVDKSAEDAAQRTKDQLAAAGGFGNTIKTGSQGDLTPARLQFKTLLGA
jgi:hypothetical protein